MAFYKPVKTTKKATDLTTETNLQIEAEIQLQPDIDMRAGRIMNINGIAAPFKGTHKFTKVVHTITPGDYVVTATALKIPNQKTGSKSPVPGKTNSKKEVVYVVKKGDNLWNILKAHKRNPMNYPALAKYNKIKNPHLIYPKQVIKIPASIG